MAHQNEFRWPPQNIERVVKHGHSVEDVQCVVWFAKHPWPRRYKRNGWEVRGRIPTGELIQVFYFIDPYDQIYVYHAQ